jgi:tRNA-dihydrouridine synthase B
MAGVTDAAFRATVLDFGVLPTMTEMIASEACVRGNAKTLRMMDFLPNESPKLVQLVGSTPERIAEAAKISADQGAEVLNLNMGCPVRKIVQGGSGAALMKDPSLVRKIVHAAVHATSLPVTVKMRLGWEAEQKNAPEIARLAEEEGAALLIVHGRTRAQMYAGEADWSAVRAVGQAVRLPLLVNGDIRDAETAQAALRASGADGVMMGRAALGAPWLPSQLASYLETGALPHPPSQAIRRQTVFRHLARMRESYGEEKAVFISRKHLCWYSRGLPGATAFRAHVNAALSIAELEQQLEALWA